VGAEPVAAVRQDLLQRVVVHRLREQHIRRHAAHIECWSYDTHDTHTHTRHTHTRHTPHARAHAHARTHTQVVSFLGEEVV
jgi:hypothetical protein